MNQKYEVQDTGSVTYRAHDESILHFTSCQLSCQLQTTSIDLNMLVFGHETW